MLSHAGDELYRFTKGSAYINIKKGRASLLSQYQNKECANIFVRVLSVSTVAAFMFDDCCFCLLLPEISSDAF